MSASSPEVPNINQQEKCELKARKKATFLKLWHTEGSIPLQVFKSAYRFYTSDI